MRRILILFLALCACFAMIAGCSHTPPAPLGDPANPTPNFPNGPPILDITGGKSVLIAWRGTTSWNVEGLNGTGTGIQMDSPHPLDCIGNIPTIKVFGETTLKLSFESAPDSIVVRKYQTNAGGYDAYEEISVKGTFLEVGAENCLYEVIAKWEDSLLRSYNGTVHYAFCTVK